MGQGIHTAIEVRPWRAQYEPDYLAQMDQHSPPRWYPAWQTVAVEVEMGRDYYLFSLIGCSSRMDKDYALYPPRGIPADMGWQAKQWWEDQSGARTPSEIPRVYDAHTPTWLGLDELRQVARRFVQTPLDISHIFYFTADQEPELPAGWAADPVLTGPSGIWHLDDGRSAIWATKQLKRIDAPRGIVPALTDLQAILALMEVYAARQFDARLIAFFDN